MTEAWWESVGIAIDICRPEMPYGERSKPGLLAYLREKVAGGHNTIDEVEVTLAWMKRRAFPV